MSVISRFKRNWISFRPNALKLIRSGKRKWTTYRSVSMWEEACFCGSWHANEIYIKGGSFDINIIYYIRAGRYDQKSISRYFSKLYRFHGI